VPSTNDPYAQSPRDCHIRFKAEKGHVNGARIFPRSGGVKFPTSFTDRLDLAGRLILPT
jgi:hypothetical protein